MKTSRLLNPAAAAVAAAFVLIVADGALAKGNNGGDHNHGQDHSDHNQMKSQSFKSDHSDKHADKHKDKDGEMRADKHKDSKQAEKTKDKDKDKDKDKTTTTSTSATPAPGSDKDLAGKGIVGPNTELKPVRGTPAPGATPGPAAVNNTIHPIPSPPPAPGAATPASPVTAIGGGLVRDKMPDGTVYVRRGTAAELAAAGPTGSGKGIITVSDGKGNSVIIPDHGAGVTVTPAGPGHVTISNGVDSRTVSGIALNISGASAVSVDKSLGTGPRQADGSTTVLTPNGTVTNTSVLPDGTFEATRDGHTP